MNGRFAAPCAGWIASLALSACVPLAPQRTAPPVLASGTVTAAMVRDLPVPQIDAPDEMTVPVKEARQPAEEVERLLSYFERLKRLQGADLTKEHDVARQAYGRTTSEFNRVSYAMTLALPGTPFNDDARVLELLNPLLKKSEYGLRPLALLLTTFVQERRRLGGDLAAVQQKLDALKSLERTLIERDQNNQGRK